MDKVIYGQRFEKSQHKGMKEDYKEILDPKDITIQFRQDDSPESLEDGFNIAVYGKGGSIKEWEYLDNITQEVFKEGTQFITRRKNRGGDE